MDPMRSIRPRRWRLYGRVALWLLLLAGGMGAGGWLVSLRGQDPSGAYRLAALLLAGAMLAGLIWAGSASMDREP